MPKNIDPNTAIAKSTLSPGDANVRLRQVLQAGKLFPKQQLLILKIVAEDAALLKQLGR